MKSITAVDYFTLPRGLCKEKEGTRTLLLSAVRDLPQPIPPRCRGSFLFVLRTTSWTWVIVVCLSGYVMFSIFLEDFWQKFSFCSAEKAVPSFISFLRIVGLSPCNLLTQLRHLSYIGEFNLLCAVGIQKAISIDTFDRVQCKKKYNAQCFSNATIYIRSEWEQPKEGKKPTTVFQFS